MKMIIGLIACGKDKGPKPAPAKDLYQGAHFKMMRNYVEAHTHRWFILSAKYGLVLPDTVIDPYNYALPNSGHVLAQWRARVRNQLFTWVSSTDVVWCLAPERYYPSPLRTGSFITPLKGLRIGYQRKWLAERT